MNKNPSVAFGPDSHLSYPSTILLNDFLRLDDLKNVKVRLLLYAGRNEDGRRNTSFIEQFKDRNNEEYQGETLLEGLFWNYKKKRSYNEGDIVIGLTQIEKGRWLLFDICKVTKDLNILNSVGYEYVSLEEEYGKYLGRVVVRYHNTSQNLVRKADSIMEYLVVEKVLPDIFDDDIFPGYENVNLSWAQMRRNMEKESWKTALQNQKGIYLISDEKTGKLYVGSAYGDSMILGRWRSYIKTGHGGNVELKAFDIDYIKRNFRYSILEIYKSTVDDDTIIKREGWWKGVLLSRMFGYNSN